MSISQDPRPEIKTKSNESGPAAKGGSRKRTRQADNPFHGVRKRSWGRYVSEIRLPGKKTRVWLGSFGSPEMAARAYDSAAFFLKGSSASLNFPDSVGSLPRPESASRRDIQLAAAKAAIGFESVGKRTGHEKNGSGAETESSIWWGLGELETASFDKVKEAPLLSPVRTFDFWGGQESCPFVDDDDFLLATCF